MALKTLNTVGGLSVGWQSSSVILSNADVNPNNLTVIATSTLGNISNVRIFGGSEGQVLRTDGAGNLSWISGAGSPGGSNTQIQFNDAGAFNGVSNFTYNKTTNLLNVNGNVVVGNSTNNVSLFASGAISSTGNFSAANINTGGVLSVTGNANVGNIGATNGVFTNISGILTTQSQPNITSVGTLSTLSVSGNSNVGNIGATNGVFTNISGNGSALTAIIGANVTGTVANATFATTASSATTAGTVTTNSQPNITSVGTLSSLSVSGNTNVGNLGTTGLISAAGNITGNFFIGNGSQLTGVVAVTAQTVTNASQPNITSVGTLTSLSVSGNSNIGNLGVTGVFATTLSATGNANVGNIGATNGVFTNISGNGASLTNLPAGNISGQAANALVAGTVYTNAQPNITSVGTLTSLNVTGNANTGNLNATNGYFANDAIVNGNLLVNGNLTYLNVETVSVEDPIIELQSGPNGAAPSSNTGKDIGTALNYFNTAARIAFMGWDVSNAEIAFGANVAISNEVVTFNQLANTRSGNILTTGVFAATLSATGNANVGNIGATNGVFTNVSGNGANIIGITKISNGNSNVGIFEVDGNISFNVSGVSNVVNVSNTTLITKDLRITSNIIHLGSNAGSNSQDNSTIAIGENAGQTQLTGAISIGFYAGQNTQSNNAIAIGTFAGGGQGLGAVAIGTEAGKVNQGETAVSIGPSAGQINQSEDSLAVGLSAAQENQGYRATAVGTSAGQVNQGSYSVALGHSAGRNYQANNSIIINATGLNLDFTTANSFVVKPIRQYSTGNILYYDNSTGEISFQSTSNITSIGTLSNLSVSGNVTANSFIGNGSQITGVVAVTAQTVTNASQPNITSVGTLTTLSVSGNANAANLGVTGVFAATLSATGNANVGNIGVSGLVTVTGNVTAANFIGTFIGNATGIANGNSNISIPTAGGNILFATNGTANRMVISNTGNVGIGTNNPAYELEVVGTLAATSKSFLIDHPTKKGWKLQYGSLESPYHGVRLTGEAAVVNGYCLVNLPDYIHGLVNQDGSQVQITAIKHGKVLWLEEINVGQNYFIVKSNKYKKYQDQELKFYWSFTATRKDIAELNVEFK